jgi:hypothetical protein
MNRKHYIAYLTVRTKVIDQLERILKDEAEYKSNENYVKLENLLNEIKKVETPTTKEELKTAVNTVLVNEKKVEPVMEKLFSFIQFKKVTEGMEVMEVKYM